MLLVIIVYLVIKKVLSIRREDPLRRGTYENIYYQFSLEHPDLWSRATGPRKYIRTKGLFSSLKWRLVTYWFAPSRTIISKPLADIDDMGLWARIKHKLARRWLNQIDIAPGSGALSAAELGEAGANEGDFGAVTELMALGTSVGMADGDPRSAMQMGENSAVRKAMLARQSRSRSSSGSRGGRLGGRPASTGSGAMVCEEGTDDDESRDKARVESLEREERRREMEESPTRAGAMQLLSVPMTVARGGEHAP
jgi:hypothetical protein